MTAAGITGMAWPRIASAATAARGRWTLPASSSAMTGGNRSAQPTRVQLPSATRRQTSSKARQPHTNADNGRNDSGASSCANSGGYE